MSYELELREAGTIVYATHRGEVGLEEILAAIAEESALAAAHDSVRAVIFDYRAASMAPLQSRDIECCAAAGARMLAEHPTLQLVGIVPEALEYGLTRMFRTHVEGGIEGEAARGGRVHVVRTVEEARTIVAAGVEPA